MTIKEFEYKMIKNKNQTFKIILIILATTFCIVSALSLFMQEKSEKEIYNSTIDKVVEICAYNDENLKFYATGCVIDSKGEILTNKHVVCYKSEDDSTPYNNLFVRFHDSNDYIVASFVKCSNDDDLALIQIDQKTKSYFKLSEKYSAGEKCFTIGNPNNFGLSFSSGVISSKLKNVKYNEKNIEAIQTDLAINEGNSGGPLINKNGYLIGIVSFRLKDGSGDIIQGVSFALNSNKIINFLNN